MILLNKVLWPHWKFLPDLEAGDPLINLLLSLPYNDGPDIEFSLKTYLLDSMDENNVF
jgi:hypothetical protein